MAAEGYAEFVPSKWSAAKALGNGPVAHAMEAALIGGTSQVIMGGGTQGFINGASSAAMSRLFNYCGKHGSKDNSCGSRMPETADGTAMDYDNAADLSSGLVANNISHSCGSFEVSVCTGVRTLFGGREVEAFTPGTSMASVYADTRSAVGHIETYADSIGYKIKGFTREVFKIIGFGGLTVDTIVNAGANYRGARAWCTASCGMDRWHRELLLENQLKAKGDW
jgi:hypothetical protein